MKKTILIANLFLYFSSLSICFGQKESRSASAIECVSGLEIRKFKISNSKPAPKLDWKVVVGREIEYHAKGLGDAEDWLWQLGGGTCTSDDFSPFWNIEPLEADEGFNDKTKKNNFKAILNGTLLNGELPASNSDFGSTHGLVMVGAKPMSSDNRLESCNRKDGTEARVQVFYEKDTRTNPDATVPNWFYYWQQNNFVQELLEIPGIPHYDLETCSHSEPVPIKLEIGYVGDAHPWIPDALNTYGICLFSPSNMELEDPYLGPNHPNNCASIEDPLNLVLVGYEGAARLNFGGGCGYQRGKDICDPNGGVLQGIHVFYNTVAHEAEHARIECEVWQFEHLAHPNIVSGYESVWDMDKDGYKDIWEEHHPDATELFETTSGTKKDKYDGQYAECFCNGDCSAGTMYEETRCRNKEKSLNHSEVDNYDWSFDKTNNYQGKNWKN